MRIITADEMGLVKVVRIESGECLAVSAGGQTRARAVQTMCHQQSHNFDTSGGAASSISSQREYGSIHLARTAGVVETWDISDTKQEGSSGNACALKLRRSVKCPATPVALYCISPVEHGNSSGRMLTCNAGGEVQIHSLGPQSSCNKSDAPKLKHFSIKTPISAAIAVGASQIGGASLAAGGRENDLKTWDVETAQCTWTAKNVPHDTLGLRQPIWISSLQPLVPGEGLQRIVAGTAYRQVRLYDTRAHKRPINSLDLEHEHGVTTMAVAPDGKEVVIADTAGYVRMLDIRKMRWGRGYIGAAGSVRSIAFHPTLPRVACVGLDRMARIYDVKSGQLKFQIYLKQRLNAVLFDNEGEFCQASRTADRGKSGNGKHREDADSESEGGWGTEEEYEMDGDSSDSGDSDEQSDGGREEAPSRRAKRKNASSANSVAHETRNGGIIGRKGEKQQDGGDSNSEEDSGSGGEGGDEDVGDYESGSDGEEEEEEEDDDESDNREGADEEDTALEERVTQARSQQARKKRRQR